MNNEKKLKQIIGRHYYDLDEENKKSSELKTVTKESTDLIGKTIGLRSPVTCACKHTCATCYGRELSAVNKDINTGLTGTLELTEPLTQMLLSAKHLLSTKTEKIDWGEEFLNTFSINMDEIYFSQDSDVTISFDKPSMEDYDEDEEAFVIRRLYILPAGSKRPIEYQSPVKLFVNEKILPTEKIKDESNEISVSSNSYGEDNYLFKYQVKNSELTKSLQEILDLIETADHLGIDNYHDLVNTFDDLLIENGLGYINSVHIEMICKTLVKDATTGRSLNFTKDELYPYVINRVSKTVMDAPLAVSLAFERINDQLIDLSTYEKNEVSMMDSLFL